MPRFKALLSDAQWELIAPLLPVKKACRTGGRPRAGNRQCLEGILWVLRSGARWQDLSDCFPSPSTCWRRLAQWEEEGLWLQIWRTLIGALDEAGLIDWEECFADGSFASAKKGALASGKPSVERVRSGWWWQTARVFLWEAPFIRPHQRKSRSSSKRSKK